MKTKILALALLVAAPSIAQTRVPAFEVERLTFNPSARGGLMVGGADLLPERMLRASLALHYEHDPLVIVDGANRQLGKVIGSRLTTHLAAAYSPTRRLEVGLQLPIIVWQGGAQGLDELGLVPVQSTAMGTPFVQLRGGWLSQEEGAPIDLSVGAMVGIPLGNADALARDNGFSVVPRIGAGRSFEGRFRASGELGAWIRPGQALTTGSSSATDTLGSQLDVGLGLSTLGEGLREELSLRLALPLTRQAAAAELLVGVRFPRGPVEFFALAGPGLGGSAGTPMFRVLGGIAYSAQIKKPEPLVEPEPLPEPVREPTPVVVVHLAPVAPKCVEGKPHDLAECPELDLDGDGVKNASDRCPEVAGEASAQGCPDGDADGIEDEKDKCPKLAGTAELEGCADTDQDALIDPEDDCPTEAGPRELRGCPLRDADGDGVADAEDNCPAEAGPKDNQGCPAKKKQLVVITREKLVIKDRVYFNTAKAVIQKRSFNLLNQVASVLLEHPEVKNVVVEGHTDSQGKEEVNRKLSQSRAESVLAYLVKQGVQASRLEAKGFGPDRPVGDNQTAAGREQNRRVEFVIGGTTPF